MYKKWLLNLKNGVFLCITKKQLSVSQKPNNVQVSGLPVPFTYFAKYLGVTLDPKLTWNLHFSKQLNKCKKKLHMLQKGVKNAWHSSFRGGFMMKCDFHCKFKLYIILFLKQNYLFLIFQTFLIWRFL